MKFEERDVQYPGRKKITKINVDPDNSNIIYADIDRAEGDVYETGTPITAENLNKANFRDDESLSFKKREDNNLPDNETEETQIITKANGEVWVIPPEGKTNFQLGSLDYNLSGKADVDANNIDVAEWKEALNITNATTTKIFWTGNVTVGGTSNKLFEDADIYNYDYLIFDIHAWDNDNQALMCPIKNRKKSNSEDSTFVGEFGYAANRTTYSGTRWYAIFTIGNSSGGVWMERSGYDTTASSGNVYVKQITGIKLGD